MRSTLQDIRYGLRMLVKSPGFTVLVVLSLALGIGANTAIFSSINALMLRTLPVRGPQSLYLLQWSLKTMQIDPLMDFIEGNEGKDERTGGATSYSFSYPAYQLMQKNNAAFSDLFAFAANEEEVNVGLGGKASSAVVQGVSGNLFAGLGVAAAVGRTILPADDNPSATPVAVVSYKFWQSRLVGDQLAVGRTVSLNGTSLTVVGVAPEEFYGVDPGVAPDLWIPLSCYAAQQQKAGMLGDQPGLRTSQKTWWLGIIGRLKPAVSAAEATAQMQLLFSQSIRAYIPNPPANFDQPRLELLPAARGLNSLREQYSRSLFLLMGMVGLVLLIACANVAGLLMARASSRQREIALRISLGAGKARIIRQLLTESLMLAVLGGAAAILVAHWGSVLLMGMLTSGRDPVNVTLHLDARVLGFTAAISILSGVLFGLAPSLAAIRAQPLTTLKQNSANATAGAKRFRSGKILVGGQIAFSLLLLISAGVLLRTLVALQRVNLGFERQGVLLFTVRPGLNGYSGARLTSYYEELERRMRAIPGVRSVAFADRNPIGSGANITLVQIPGYTGHGKPEEVYRHVVDPGYFATLKIPVLLGRAFGEGDTASAQPVVVVNRTFANKYFAGGDPLLHEVSFGPHVQAAGMQIVGVVEDVKYDRIRDEAPPTIYVAYTQAKQLSPDMTYELKTSGANPDLVRSIENQTLSLDAGVPIVNLHTEDEVVEQVLYLERIFALLSSAFGGLALMLACVGIYGTIAYTVAQRTGEIGIRIALGAERANILRMVLRETLAVVAAGMLVGLPLAWLGTRLLREEVFGLSPHDPLTWALAVIAIGAVTTLAGFVPARRASRVEPVTALRCE